VTVNVCLFGHYYHGITEEQNVLCGPLALQELKDGVQTQNASKQCYVSCALGNIPEGASLLRSERLALRTFCERRHIELRRKSGLQTASGWQPLSAIELPC
jgi:hypothetical protein